MGDGDGVSREQFVHAIERGLNSREDFERIYRQHVQAVADLADTDNDGQLDQAEYQTLMRLMRVDDGESAVAFAQIDINDDGRLTVDELVEAARRFYLDPGSIEETTLFGRV